MPPATQGLGGARRSRGEGPVGNSSLPIKEARLSLTDGLPVAERPISSVKAEAPPQAWRVGAASCLVA